MPKSIHDITQGWLWLSGSPELKMELLISLQYCDADPFAVSVTFYSADRTSKLLAEWTFGRDLLAEGLQNPVGEGEVCIRPYMRESCILHFRTLQGCADVECPAAAIVLFLQETYAVVAAGCEAEKIDWQLARSQIMMR